MFQFIRSLFANPAPWQTTLTIADIRRLELKPGDVVVVKSTIVLSREQAVRMRQMLEALLAGHKVVVLDRGTSLGVVREVEGDDVVGSLARPCA